MKKVPSCSQACGAGVGFWEVMLFTRVAAQDVLVLAQFKELKKNRSCSCGEGGVRVTSESTRKRSASATPRHTSHHNKGDTKNDNKTLTAT